MQNSDAIGRPKSAAELEALLEWFVSIHKGMRQRDASWYTAMGTTIGGSEVAALLGCNPYSKPHDIVESKVAMLRGLDKWRGGAACDWGVLFEDIIASYVEIDLGGRILGDDICVQRYPGHRNSPDGYIVAHWTAPDSGAPTLESVAAAQVWTTDMCPSRATLPRILLLEFKCPMSRQVNGDVPKQYRPQLWSGLAVSPVAHLGLFVDAMFRKCALADLGPDAGYDTSYHSRDSISQDSISYEGAVAWGLVGVYAPARSAPRHARFGWRGTEWAEGDPVAVGQGEMASVVDGAAAAWRMRQAAESDGGVATLPEDLILPDLIDASLADSGCPAVTSPADTDSFSVIDMGAADGALFEQILRAVVDGKHMKCLRLPPCFRDGRGLDLHSAAAVVREIGKLRSAAPAHHELLAVLPWKLFNVAYVPVARRANFMEELAPLIADVHRRVAAALASADPDAHLRAARPATRPRTPRAATSDVSADMMQALFNMVK